MNYNLIKNISIFLLSIALIVAVNKILKIEKKLINAKKEIEKINIEKSNLEKNFLSQDSIFDFYNISENEKQQLLGWSRSQIKQDIFVYLESNRKNNGFYVEFGATDGYNLSNSNMLEQKFGWRGILAEPAIVWHDKLKVNRPNAIIENDCVWSTTGEKLTFNETNIAHLSTVDDYSGHDDHSSLRKEGNKYEVTTISLLDLLKKHNAPKEIDYLSIDTEGSELVILEAFFRDNNYYKIKIITCEHNYTKNRNKIYQLLAKHGYQRKYQEASKWDDFYVLVNDSNS